MKEIARAFSVPGVSPGNDDGTAKALRELVTRLSKRIGLGKTVHGYIMAVPSGENSVNVTVFCREQDVTEVAPQLMLS